jgi:hypothetical protein
MENNRKTPVIYRIILLFTSCSLLVTLIGCEAFVRKFTRKSKKSAEPVEMVLAPEEWKGPQITKEELYRRYFMFWKTWHDELIQSLLDHRSQKKKIDCAEEAIKNLVNLRPLLDLEKQKKLDSYISQLRDLQGDIVKDLYGAKDAVHTPSAERLKMNILRDFPYPKAEKDLIHSQTPASLLQDTVKICRAALTVKASLSLLVKGRTKG